MFPDPADRFELDETVVPPRELWDLLEAVTDGLWWRDLVTGAVAYSRKLVKTLGLPPTPADWRDLTLAERVHPDDQPIVRAALEAHFLEGRPYAVRVRVRRGDDSYVWMSARGIARRDDSGKAIAMLGYLVDIDVEKDREVALRRSEARFRAFMDNSPVAVFLKSEDGVHLYANDEASRLAGISVGDMIGRRTEELFPGETGRRLAEVDRQVLASGQPRRWSGHIDRPDGEARWIVDVKFPVPNMDGGADDLGGFGLDLTDVHRAQQAAETGQRLESLGLLAGGIAHDFNNLLVGIVGSAEQGLAEPASASRSLETILGLTRRAADLCREVLAYAGQETIEPAVVDPGTLVTEASELLRLSTGGQATLEVEAQAGLRPVRVDVGQIRRVLLNLALNAAEAARGGNVWIRCEDVAALPPPSGGAMLVADDVAGDHGFARLSVRDDGRGISPGDMHRIFEPFFTTKDVGSGLGLSAVHGIVRRHRGAVRVSSGPDGTLFEVFLPSVDAALDAPPKIPTPSTPEALEGRPVLVVDDDPVVTRVASRMLRRRGAEVLTAASGEEALDLLASGRPVAVVLLDLTMPRMSGAEVLGRIAALYPDLPVIVSSGYGRGELEAQGLAGRVAAFLPKPYRSRELDAAIEEAIGKP